LKKTNNGYIIKKEIMKNESDKKIRRGFIKLTGDVGCTLEEVAIYLMLANIDGFKIYANFNGHILYSDTVTVERAYRKIFGMSKTKFDKKSEAEFKELYAK
jgi:hypothetical protein